MQKERIVELVKEWIKVDNEIKDLQKQSRDKRNEKKELTDMLIDIMKNNEIDSFDTTDCKILYDSTKVKTSLSKKHITSSIMEYFKDDLDKGNELMEHILESRDEKIKDTIKRKNK
jgi:hypothetical protein